MTKGTVMSILDRNIIKLFDEGLSLRDIVENVFQKDIKFRAVLLRDFKDVDVDTILATDLSEIKSSRTRYYIYYINHCNKRIIDLNWILRNKFKFPDLNNVKIFKLLILKDKLSIENSVDVSIKSPMIYQGNTIKGGYYFESNKI
jgi:hypothetical protein